MFNNRLSKPIQFLFLFVTIAGFSQDVFKIDNNSKSSAISFKMVNDLIVVPVEMNGSKLNFLLDTGVNQTLMFNISLEDSTKLKNTRKIKIRGLGEGNFIDAVQSIGNTLRIGKIKNNEHKIFLIPGKEFNLSARLGIDINGIIGGALFKDMVVDINYTNKRLKFYNPSKYKYKKCKKCEILDLTFYKKKPYVDIKIKSKKDIIDTHLLIDTGGGKALWLFDKSTEQISTPDKYFNDFLGKGLSGNIYGKKSKIEEIIIGKYTFKNANVAYPDSASIPTAYNYKKRNGSLGANILKRFRLIFDYAGKKIIFKRKSKFYEDPFQYDKSGLEIIHGGKMLVQNRSSDGTLELSGGKNKTIVQILYEYVYDFKPVYEIALIRKDSPGDKTGLRVKDKILQINGKLAYNYKLSEIIHMLSQEEGKLIKLLIERNGVKMFYSFRLKDMLK